MSANEQEKRHHRTEDKGKYMLDISDESIERIDRLVDEYYTRIMTNLDQQYLHQTRKSDKIADAVAAFGGSWKFIIIFASVLVVWVLWNTLPFIGVHFDPEPYILLNLCLSFIAAFQAPLIMMSQNRQAERDKHEAVIDFAINYKAEQEVDDMQRHLHAIEKDIADIKETLAALKLERPID
jgi:uncharacterized membrane protein